MKVNWLSENLRWNEFTEDSSTLSYQFFDNKRDNGQDRFYCIWITSYPQGFRSLKKKHISCTMLFTQATIN